MVLVVMVMMMVMVAVTIQVSCHDIMSIVSCAACLSLMLRLG